MVALSQLFILASCLASTFAAPPSPFLTKREAYDDVVEYMDKIKTQVGALDGTIAAFPTTGGTLVQGLAIHNSATELSYRVDTT
ncbi:hypothetical protein ONZ45_g17253 [Pleurotus djamor]|nr:hypothetical protein ONZ45_g17253 [Pleurotus djamor]